MTLFGRSEILPYATAITWSLEPPGCLFFQLPLKTNFLTHSLILFGCFDCLYLLHHVARFEVDLSRHRLSHRGNRLLCPLVARTGKSSTLGALI